MVCLSKNKPIAEEQDWEFLDFALDAEKQWKQDLRQSLPKTTTGWLEIFPEAKKIIPAKIKEWKQQAEVARLLIGEVLQLIEMKAEEENRWFWHEVIKYTFPPMQEFVNAKRHIKRLKWIAQRKKKSKGGVSESEIAMAKQQDLVRIAEIYGLCPKQSGQAYMMLCPHSQHNDHTPSFCIYPPTHYVCFGCNIKGDQISFVQMIENCSFVDAVRKLQNI